MQQIAGMLPNPKTTVRDMHAYHCLYSGEFIFRFHLCYSQSKTLFKSLPKGLEFLI